MKLSQYLAERQLTAERFGNMAGVAHTTITRLLRGECMPREATRRRLSAATNGLVSEGDLAAEAAERTAAQSVEAA